MRDLTHNLGVALAGRDVLVLGAGGAARGIMSSLLAEHPRSLTICQSHDGEGRGHRAAFAPHGPVAAVPPAALAGRAFDIVINATSAGLAGDVAAAVARAASFAGRVRLRHDLRRRAHGVPALGAARNGAARTADGLGMLIEQAAESFFLWRGVRPDTAPVFALLRPPEAA